MSYNRTKKASSLILILLVPGVLVFFFATGCTPGVMPPRPDQRGDDWTVMVFINADNNLEMFGWKDLQAMEMVGSTSRVNIVAQLDIYSGSARRYLIQRKQDQSWLTSISSPVLQELGEVNMGDPSTLVDFVRFSVERFPAQRYALIVWNHGTGFKGLSRNISFDDTFRDSITIPELGWALSQATAYTGKPIEFLGLDACLMNLVEVAYEVSPYARVMVASQENEPADGWDYFAWLSRLTESPAMNGFELGRAVADTYLAFYGYGSVTQSVIDLSRLNGLSRSLDHFARAVIADQATSPAVYRSIAQHAFNVQGDPDYIDLIDFLVRVASDGRVASSTVHEAAQSALAEAEAAVFYNRAGGSLAGQARGISVYFPLTSYHDGYDQLAFTRDTAWNDMLHALGLRRSFASTFSALALGLSDD